MPSRILFTVLISFLVVLVGFMAFQYEGRSRDRDANASICTIELENVNLSRLMGNIYQSYVVNAKITFFPVSGRITGFGTFQVGDEYQRFRRQISLTKVSERNEQVIWKIESLNRSKTDTVDQLIGFFGDPGELLITRRYKISDESSLLFVNDNWVFHCGRR